VQGGVAEARHLLGLGQQAGDRVLHDVDKLVLARRAGTIAAVSYAEMTAANGLAATPGCGSEAKRLAAMTATAMCTGNAAVQHPGV